MGPKSRRQYSRRGRGKYYLSRVRFICRRCNWTFVCRSSDKSLHTISKKTSRNTSSNTLIANNRLVDSTTVRHETGKRLFRPLPSRELGRARFLPEKNSNWTRMPSAGRARFHLNFPVRFLPARFPPSRRVVLIDIFHGDTTFRRGGWVRRRPG